MPPKDAVTVKMKFAVALAIDADFRLTSPSSVVYGSTTRRIWRPLGQGPQRTRQAATRAVAPLPCLPRTRQCLADAGFPVSNRSVLGRAWRGATIEVRLRLSVGDSQREGGHRFPPSRRALHPLDRNCINREQNYPQPSRTSRTLCSGGCASRRPRSGNAQCDCEGRHGAHSSSCASS